MKAIKYITVLIMVVHLSVFVGCRSVPEEAPDAAREHLLADFPKTIYTAPDEEAIPRGRIAVVVHGLFRSSHRMRKIAKTLSDSGYEVYSYDYETMKASIRPHGERFREFLVELALANPDKPIDLVTHSLGGPVTRYALAHLDPEAPEEWKDPEAAKVLTSDRFGRFVMLTPPNLGSRIASETLDLIPGSEKLVKPLPDLSLAEDALVKKLPVIYAIPTGIIVAKYDVAVLPGCTDYPAAVDTITIGVTHSQSVLSRRVCAAIRRFLDNGKF